MRVGVLAIQGDFSAHAASVAALGHEPVLIKTAPPLDDVAALLMPGGETTTMLKFLAGEALMDPLAAFCRSGRPVLGTCAGAILLAREVSGPTQASLGVLDVSIERNGYGRQLDSFETTLTDTVEGLADLPAVFIRAPIIRSTGPEVAVLARHDGQAVLVRQGPIFAATFHPEMTADRRLHERVLAEALA